MFLFIIFLMIVFHIYYNISVSPFRKSTLKHVNSNQELLNNINGKNAVLFYYDVSFLRDITHSKLEDSFLFIRHKNKLLNINRALKNINKIRKINIINNNNKLLKDIQNFKLLEPAFKHSDTIDMNIYNINETISDKTKKNRTIFYITEGDANITLSIKNYTKELVLNAGQFLILPPFWNYKIKFTNISTVLEVGYHTYISYILSSIYDGSYGNF